MQLAICARRVVNVSCPLNYRHGRNSHARLLDRYAALFETAAVATLKRVDVACIALRLCAV
jgi:hypothetical protein